MSDEIRVKQLWQTACVMIQAGNGWKAKDLLRTIITTSPGHAAARSELAGILQADGDIDAALLQSAFAYKLNPDLPGLARRLGELFVLTSFYAEAIECFERAVQSGDKDVEVAEKLILCREVINLKGHNPLNDIQ